MRPGQGLGILKAMTVRAGIALLAMALGACQVKPTGQAPAPSLALRTLFGPVVGNEVIGGRADAEPGVVWLLAGGTDLVRIDLDSHRVRRLPLKIAAADHCWGLGRLADGSLWTLKGRRAIVRIGEDGEIAQEIALPSPHLGLFATGDRLIYQRADFVPSVPALRAGRPGDDHPQVWSGLTTRAFETLARGSAVALNLVSCGSSAGPERACWFPDEAAVAVIDATGETRHLALAGLDVVSPAILLTAENPPRPVRDAYLDETGALWVLSSGTPPPGAPDRPGGWILARYGRKGELLALRTLSESVRLILGATAGRPIVLTGAGLIAEVMP
jgi:hypothetical protein